jgi:predicted TIM-barrel enzyme
MALEHTFSRAEVVERLRTTIREGRPILGAGCSNGLVAKCAEAGGADLLIVYSTGRSRMMGLPTTPIGHANPVTLEMYDELANVVNDTPIIGGVEAADPTYMSLKRLVRLFQEKGYAGVINFPTVATSPERAAMREDVGLGYSREVEMVRVARSLDYFSMAYVFTVEQARRMAAAGVDVQVAHVGWTVGGLAGRSRDRAPSFEHAAEQVQAMIDVTLKEQPECICLAHGGPYAGPEDTRQLYSQTSALGFVGASSIERIPIERAVREAVAAFKAIPLKPPPA